MPVMRNVPVYKVLGWCVYTRKEETNVAAVGATDSTKAKKLIVPALCPDFVVTLGPYFP